MSNYYVYTLIDPRDDSIFYVGKTNNLLRRFRSSWENDVFD